MASQTEPRHPHAKLKVLVFAASLRAESLNRKLAALAARIAEQNGATVDLASMRDFDVPSTTATSRASKGIPAGAEELRRRLLENDAFIVSSPEYNALDAGMFEEPDRLDLALPPAAVRRAARAPALARRPRWPAATGACGRCAVPLEHLGARIFPDMFSLAMAHKAFADGDIADPRLRARFEKNLQAFLSLAEAAKHYPCIKRAWVEFLGEPPGAGVDRVDPVPQGAS